MVEVSSDRYILPLTMAILVLAARPAHAESSAPAADAEATDVRAEIDALRAEQLHIAKLQSEYAARLRALEARLRAENANVSSDTKRASASAAPETNAARGALPTGERLVVSGDLRVRAQGDYSDHDGSDRNSSQVRGRLGATYSPNERVTIGTRLVTGDADDPNSTDAQLSNFDDKFQVSLDLAYLQLNVGALQVFGGKIPQPFTRTDLVWDGDVNPQGLGATYRHALANGSILRANGLFFLVDEQASGPESTMAGVQLGYNSAARGAWKYDVNVAYYDYSPGSTVGADSGDFRTNLRTAAGAYLSDFNLADVVASFSWSGSGERWPMRLTADYVRNFGATTDADTGYALDLTLGRASALNDWRVSYGYAVAETDAVLAAFSHDNTSIGTNYRMHTLSLDYVPWRSTQISAIWYHYRPYRSLDAGPNEPSDWLDRLRLALLVSF